MDFNFTKEDHDMVLLYKNQDGLAEAVYKSESPTLYQKLINNKNVFYIVTFKEQNREGIEKYIELTRETVERQGFYAHSAHYHKLMWECLHIRLVKQGEKPIARLLTAIYKGEIITAWIVFVWHDFLYYPYGASSDKYKNVMANNLMLWEAIRYGKKLEPGKGFTKFKEGYNPRVVEFLGTWDLPTSPFYWPYRVAEAIRWAVLRAKGKFTKPRF